MMMLLPTAGLGAEASVGEGDYSRGMLTQYAAMQAFLNGREVTGTMSFNVEDLDLSHLPEAAQLDEKQNAILKGVMELIPTIGMQGKVALVDDGLSAGMAMSLKDESVFNFDMNVNAKEFKMMSNLLPNKVLVYDLSDVIAQVQALISQNIAEAGITGDDVQAFFDESLPRYAGVFLGWMFTLDKEVESTESITFFDEEIEVNQTTMVITSEQLVDLLTSLLQTVAEDPYVKDLKIDDEQTLAEGIEDILPDLAQMELFDVEVSTYTDATNKLTGVTFAIDELFAVQASMHENGEETKVNLIAGSDVNYFDLSFIVMEGEESTQVDGTMATFMVVETAGTYEQNVDFNMDITGDSTSEKVDVTMELQQEQNIDDVSIEVDVAGTNEIVTTVSGEDFTQNLAEKYQVKIGSGEESVACTISADVQVKSAEATGFGVGQDLEIVNLNTMTEEGMQTLMEEVQKHTTLLAIKVMSLLPADLLLGLQE